MNIDKKCNHCNDALIVGDNWTENAMKKYDNTCKKCRSVYDKEYRKKNVVKKRVNDKKYHETNKTRCLEMGRIYRYSHGGRPMSENRECTSYLGVHVAEQVLSKVFINVQVMPYGNKGYDFICHKGMKIDVKSSCLRADREWSFTIGRNKIPDYFLCIAFDNRNDLNPMHLWLLPAMHANMKRCVSISNSTLSKWDKYKVDMTDVIEQCNEMKQSRVVNV